MFGLFEATFTREFEILNQLFNKQFCPFCDPALYVNGNNTIIGPQPITISLSLSLTLLGIFPEPVEQGGDERTEREAEQKGEGPP